MNEPLIFTPIVKSNVWGGEFLQRRNPNSPPPPVGESWEIADHGTDTTIVSAGKYQGKSLHQLYREVCGTALDPASPEIFPLLLKIIDPLDDLSVQVHPDDAYAGSKKAGELGKTEAWYILSAGVGAKIYRGVKEGVTKEIFTEAIKTGNCAELLKKVPVKAGDVVFLPHGTIHALCGGVRIVEIQQNSDTTYRVFDWNRVGLDGKPRQLHIEDAAQVSDFSNTTKNDLCIPTLLFTPGCKHERFIDCEKFVFERMSNFSNEVELDTKNERFHILTVVAGSLKIQTTDGIVVRNELDSILIPAGVTKYRLFGHSDTNVLLFYRP